MAHNRSPRTWVRSRCRRVLLRRGLSWAMLCLAAAGGVWLLLGM